MKPMQYVWTFLVCQAMSIIVIYLPVSFFVWSLDLVFLRITVVAGFYMWVWFLGWVHFEKGK